MDLQDRYDDLANAIIRQAAKDWVSAMKQLKKKPGNKQAQAMRRECEQFFHSGWYSMLTDADGDYILNALRREL